MSSSSSSNLISVSTPISNDDSSPATIDHHHPQTSFQPPDASIPISETIQNQNLSETFLGLLLRVEHQNLQAPNNNISTQAQGAHQFRMTNVQRRLIAQIMLINYTNGKLKYGLLKRLMNEYKLSKTTIGKYWKQVHEQIKAGKLVNVDRNYKGSKKRVIIDLEMVRHIPLHKRTSVRSLACAMNLHPSTVHRLVQKGKIRSHSSALKPSLTEKNMKERMQWVLDKISWSSLHDNMTFLDMYYVVHIDEKWFFMTRCSQKYYLLPDEMEPQRTCKSKRFITKIMFMGAVARPVISKDGTVLFDGKIGIFPFSVIVPAKRASKNRVRGTLEQKPIERINKTVIKQCILQKVLPAIKSKFHDKKGRKIFIQQDNAKPHISTRDPDFVAAATADGWDIELICQPPNSPDLNVLDLGHFRTIQTIQHEKAPKTGERKQLLQAPSCGEIKVTKAEFVTAMCATNTNVCGTGFTTRRPVI
ncbi:uncharacterized protein LOC141651206 [Silene latifolia]|uniref:uncharacterized protein LOC141651206 n=1 Tax=Silene latifolia TaxID=37657 RepID=UPI003D778251